MPYCINTSDEVPAPTTLALMAQTSPSGLTLDCPVLGSKPAVEIGQNLSTKSVRSDVSYYN